MNSEIKYYRINDTNTAIASTNSGDGNPTEEITAPISAGLYQSGSGTNTIIAQTNSFGSLTVGMFLYYINSSGNYILMGQISSIANPASSVTLTGNSVNVATPQLNAPLAGSYSLITTTESIYIRVKTDTTSLPAQVIIPNFRQWRTSGDNTNGVNQPSITTLEQISNTGDPVSTAASTTPISFTIRTMNNFVFTTGASPRAWPTSNEFPKYMWLRVTPAVSNQSLASKTLYRWTTQESFDGVPFTAARATVTNLQDLGYNITSGSSVGVFNNS